MTRAEMIAKLREAKAESPYDDDLPLYDAVVQVADALEQETRELVRVRDEIAESSCNSCGGTGWIRVPAERKKYECGDCVSGLNVSGEAVNEWADALTRLIGDGK